MEDTDLTVQASVPPMPAQDPSSRVFIGSDGLRAGWSLLLYIALLAVMLTSATWVVRRVHPTPSRPKATQHGEIPLSIAITGEAIPFSLVVLATAIMARVEKRPFTAYGSGGTGKLPLLLAGLAWGVAFLSLLVLALKTMGLLVFDQRLLTGTAILRYGALWLIGFLMVGLFEEYLMRGFLQFTLARGLAAIYRLLNIRHDVALGFWTAALLLSILFGLGHGSNPGESPIGLLSAALAALVFCLSLWRTGSLWWAVGFHASWDWAQSFLYGVADSGNMAQHHLFATHPLGRPLVSGGATGPEGSLYILPTLALAAVVILLTLHRAPLKPTTDTLHIDLR